jgi:hypothetical protein
MRLAILAVMAAGCGGHASPPAAPPGPPVAFPAARWVPAKPLYVFASPTVEDAQRTARDAIELVAAATGIDLRDAARASAAVFGVDVLHPDPLAAIGVDLQGSWAVFGDDLDPTLVVHLAAPAQMSAFLDRQRERGLVTRSAIVDRTEVISATVLTGVTVSLAIDGEWMWVHLALSGTGGGAGADGARWFTASHAPHEAGWSRDWAWAQRMAGAARTLVGVLDLHGALAGAVARIAAMPDALACARLTESIGKVGFAVESDGHHVAAHAALDVGSTDRLRSMILPAPSGWEATAGHAALAVQWNLDLAAARGWLAPCMAVVGTELELLDRTGVRTARAMLLGFEPDSMSGSGAIALDLTSTTFLERQLDRIPGRSMLARERRFGPYRGFSLSIPFSVTVDYVLDPKLAIAALGDGVLAGLVAPGAPAPAPIFAVDVAPPVLSARAWETVLHGLAERRLDGSPGSFAHRAAEHLMAWRDAHLAVTAGAGEDAGAIVVSLSGDRR